MKMQDIQTTQGKSILITGASGFIGSFIVERALSRGLEVWAAVRPTSSRRYLTDGRIRFINLDLGDKAKLKDQLRGRTFNYVVHAAGVTKCADSRDFHRVNTVGTLNLAEAITEQDAALERFVFVSSLSVMGAVREQRPYTEITADDEPQPNTAYGRSKLEAERGLRAMKGLPLTVLRPTGVYGPRERDYFLMAQSISRHTDFSVGYKPQDITFIYVKDLVQTIFLALNHEPSPQPYLLSDGHVYSSRTFSDLLHSELGRPWLVRIKAPLWLLRIVTTVGELYGRVTGRVTALNRDKYNILRQRNWRCDISPAQRDLGFTPEYDLQRGVKETIKWYKENEWL